MPSQKTIIVSLLPILLAIMPSLCGTAIMWAFIHWHSKSSLSNFNFSVIYFTITCITMTLALTPTTMVALVGGYLFGWMYFPALIIIYMIAALLSAYTNHFLLSKVIKYNPTEDFKIAPLLIYFEGKYFMLIALMRLSPVLPFAVTNYVLSALPLKKMSYLSASLLGMLPRTIMVFWAGTIASDIWAYLKHPYFSGSFQFAPIILLMISTGGLILITKKALAKAKAIE